MERADPAGGGPSWVLSVGHSNHPVESFVALLVANGVDVVADVRSHPHSRYSPQYNRPALEAVLTDRGIAYAFLGAELGGRPLEAKFYGPDGHVRYELVGATPRFLDGICRLQEMAARSRVAVMCAEENPAACHRRLLVGPALASLGVDVRHLRGDGTLTSGAELVVRGPSTGQPTLFGD